MPHSAMDAELQGHLSTGLEYVRAHPDVIDEIFDSWKAPHMERLYGQKTIEQVRQWVLSNEIPVVLSWGLQNAKMPCLSLHLAQDQERVDVAALSDHGGYVEVESERPVVLEAFVPRKYNPTSGVITLPKGSTSLFETQIVPGHVLVDAKKEEYLVTTPITEDSFAILLEGDAPNLTKVFVKNGPGMGKTLRRGGSSRFLTHIDIGFHADSNYQTVLWMYYIVSWILFRFKLDMEKNGIQNQTYSGSEFNKDSKYLPENVYSRWMRFSAQVSVEWTEPVEGAADFVDLTTRESFGDTVLTVRTDSE